MRQFPKSGFYVAQNYQQNKPADLSNPFLLEVIYVSGTTKGNFYWYPRFHGNQWNKLTWTCVPGMQDINKYYDYYADNPVPCKLPT